MKKLLDIMAAACLLFDVDWEEEFGDDAYVLACRREEAAETEKIRVIPGTAPSRAV